MSGGLALVCCALHVRAKGHSVCDAALSPDGGALTPTGHRCAAAHTPSLSPSSASALGCRDASCALCAFNPCRACGRTFARKYLVGDALRAACGAPVRVALVGADGEEVGAGAAPELTIEVRGAFSPPPLSLPLSSC